MSITQGEHELQQCFGSFTNNIPIGFIQKVYAATKTVTANGNAKIDTAQSKFGGASGSLLATSYLTVPDSSDFDFGSGDFTIDFWVRFNTLPSASGAATFFDHITSGTEVFLRIYNSAGTYQVNLQEGSNNYYYNTSPNLAINTWYHFAWTRASGTDYVFQNGTQIGSGTNLATLPAATAPTYIGTRYDGASNPFDGWLDEYRVTKGLARWTGGTNSVNYFTPPTAEYASDSYTVLLLHMDGANGSTTFTDDSAVIGRDFSVSASPTSQGVGAGSTAFYTLNLAASGGYTGTVSLTVTSGCPSGVTCTIAPTSVSSFPSTATLSVPTLITTPGGATNVIVTGTDASSPPITHTAQVSLTVVGPTSFSFNVKSSATQVVVTLMYSWTGSGAPPQGTIAIGPSGTPTYMESGAVVYDRTSISVSGSGNTYNLIHRVTFTITAPGSAQVWTAYVSLSNVSTYTLTIEVS